MFKRPRGVDVRELGPLNNDIKFQILDMNDFDCWSSPDENTGSLEYRVFLFGVTPKGQSITCVVEGFNPFFYVRIPDTWNLDQLHRYANFIRTKILSKHYTTTIEIIKSKDIWGFQNGEERNFGKFSFTTLGHYYSAVRAISENRPKGLDTHGTHLYEASDVILKFIHATQINSWVYIKSAERVSDPVNYRTCLAIRTDINSIVPLDSDDLAPILQCSIDIETYQSTDVFSNPEVDGDVVFTIASVFKIYGSDDFCYRHCVIIGDIDPVEGVVIDRCQNERELLFKWITLIEDTDPDLFITYNGDSFDFRFLYVRAQKCSLGVRFGRVLSRIGYKAAEVKDSTFESSAHGKKDYQRLICPGRLNFDLLPWIRKSEKLKNYKLNTVAAALIMEEKDDITIEELFRAYRTGDRALLLKVANYCVQDTHLPQKIMDKRSIWPNLVEFSKATWVPISYYFTRGEEIKVYSQILRLAMKKNFRIPKIQGKKNEDLTNTLTTDNGKKFAGAKVLEPEVGMYWNPVSVLDFASLYPSIIRGFNFCYSSCVMDSAYDHIDGVDYHTVNLPTGPVKFVQNTETVLPELLSELAVKRKSTKKLMASVEKSKDPIQYVVLDAKQLAFKISMNSVYGFLAAHKLPLLQIGASVTTEGRAMLDMTKERIETKWDGKIVYGDTDSVFVLFNPSVERNMKEVFEYSQRCAADVTSLFKSPNELEFEKVYYPLVLLKKKMYIGYKYTKPEKGEVEKKGIQTERKDTCDFLVSVMNNLINGITNGFAHRDKLYDKLVLVIDTQLQLFLDPKFDIRKLAVTKTWRSDKASAHRVVGEKMKKRGESVENNDKISFVFVLGEKRRKTSAGEKMESLEYVLKMNGDSVKVPIDKRYYIENVLRNPLMSLMGPLSRGQKDDKKMNDVFAKHIKKAEELENKWFQRQSNEAKKNFFERCKKP